MPDELIRSLLIFVFVSLGSFAVMYSVYRLCGGRK
jgi:hypothetical protein